MDEYENVCFEGRGWWGRLDLSSKLCDHFMPVNWILLFLSSHQRPHRYFHQKTGETRSRNP